MKSKINRRQASKVILKRLTAISLCVVMMFLLCACKHIDYKKAKSLLDDGDYKEAMEIFAELGDYKDSHDQMLYCEFHLHIENEEYKQALEAKRGIDDAYLRFKLDIPAKAISSDPEICTGERIIYYDDDNDEYGFVYSSGRVWLEANTDSAEDAGYLISIRTDRINKTFGNYGNHYGVSSRFDFHLHCFI